MQDNFYVTTSIVYTNARPHLGFALELVQADAIARWQRRLGKQVFFLTGTDEHGIKIARAAETAGKNPSDFVGEIADEAASLKPLLNLSWDSFIRTSDSQRHWPGAQALWRALEASGDIYEREYAGLYCVGCENFLTEKELEDSLCPIHKKEPERVEEKNLFFRLSKYSNAIKQAIESGELQILPETRRNETLAFIEGGLEDISFSRSRDKLAWGIPVPGYEDQTMYVWCDALSNYVSAIGYGGDQDSFKKWWPADIHLVGKDIMRFHTIYWPAMLLSAGLPLPKSIWVHGFITVEGEKMAKSIGNVIYPKDLVEKYGADAVRYYLLKEILSYEDGDFNEKRFVEHYNSDLANGFGNFSARVTTLAEKAGGLTGLVPSPDIRAQIEKTALAVAQSMQNFRLNEAIAAIWSLISFGDGYVNDRKPWQSGDKQVMCDLLYLLDAVAELAEPIIPEASAKVRAAIQRDRDHLIGASKVSNLFPRLDA